jgi:hypothetical protein
MDGEEEERRKKSQARVENAGVQRARRRDVPNPIMLRPLSLRGPPVHPFYAPFNAKPVCLGAV